MKPTQPEPSIDPPSQKRALLGMILILIGIGLLITYLLKMAWIPVWVADLSLLIWGVYQKANRLILGGGILTGTGLAIALDTSMFAQSLPNSAHNNWFFVLSGRGLVIGSAAHPSRFRKDHLVAAFSWGRYGLHRSRILGLGQGGQNHVLPGMANCACDHRPGSDRPLEIDHRRPGSGK